MFASIDVRAKCTELLGLNHSHSCRVRQDAANGLRFGHDVRRLRAFIKPIGCQIFECTMCHGLLH